MKRTGSTITTARVLPSHHDGTGSAAIEAAFRRAKGEGRCALITYLTVGYPTLADTVPLVDNGTPEGRAYNRRVDIIILSAGHL